MSGDDQGQDRPKNQHAAALSALGASKGGLARAAKLTDEQRSEIAKKAAAARWADRVVKAAFGAPDKPLRIGNAEIPCYVLEDDTRVLVQAGFLSAIGRHPKANVRREGGEEQVPAILQGKAIRPFISQEILEKSRPIRFQLPSGVMASGYRADLLPDVCEVYLKARDANVLPPNQRHVAKQAEILMRGLAHVGIIALVDEATGYQYDRARRALAEILEQFISKDLARWAKTFDDDYYREIFRLRGWDATDITKRPGVVGRWTTDIVYARLAPGVLAKLREVTPRDERGRLKHKLFQRLTPDTGVPALREHLASVTTIMKLANDWEWFRARLDRLHPRYNETLLLPFKDPPAPGEEHR